METTKTTTNLVATIELEVLTPIHIGTGQKMAPNAGFVAFPQEKRVAVLDEEKILDVVGVDQIQAWVGLIHNRQDLLPWLQQRRPGLKAAEVARRTLHTPGPLGGTQEFRPMMHTGVAGELPYVPGSSVKGAIRTALFAEAVCDPAGEQHLNAFPANSQIGGNWTAERMTKSVFGADPNHDYLRLLHVGDAHFVAGGTHCIKAFAHNQHGLGEQAKFQDEKPHLLEVLPVGAKATATWQLAHQLAARDRAEAERQQTNRVLNPPDALADFDALLQALNAHTQRLIEHELQQLPARENAREDNGYRKELLKVQAVCKQCAASNGREAVLRVGFGSGHTFMTGGWLDKLTQTQREKIASAVRDKPRQNKFYDPALPFPKSRKLVPGAEGGAVAVPLGFLKLTLLSEAEQAQRAAEAGQRAVEAAERAQAERIAAEQQAIEDAAEALRRAEAAKVPEYFTGKLKAETTVDAIYDGPERANPQMRQFRLLLEAPGKEVKMSVKIGEFAYPTGTLMRITIKSVTKKGAPESLQISPLPKPKAAQ